MIPMPLFMYPVLYPFRYAFLSVVKERKSIVEHPYGTIKRAMEAGYCLCKRKGTVSGEFALTFLAYNMKRVINILGIKKLLKAFA
jgi:hypothetical protein